ncbi:TonB-dependent receptor [Rhodanobacter sp. 7MK24]|uniref:TonB-dependent receptor plug domain-containing protein n=1 Tax=Rhodanobacter sp. 7MK24 TaxID=2775922 RepID=UPI0017824168|nr:TonB-dependent receptor [Rhodanobacter sp. 7MK24]MBD8879954.1 TonB-dependent receptor [Rhodanobacter sp. 7MK24]
MMKSKLTIAVVTALACGVVPVSHAAGQSQQDSSSQTQGTTQQSSGSDQSTSGNLQDKQAKRLDAVVVSGSLINNAQIQTATPTYTITAEDIQARGFTSVAQVLQNVVQATGSVQGPQASGGFTQGAQVVSLYGLNPEYTLTLIDGKPITQFGQLYNGQSNFTNISNIPLSMIDHVDVIPGGGSSIYGSAAIAGVINIVTKQHMDGAEVFVRTGNYDGGGGAEQHITLSFGHDYGKLNVLGSLEFDNQSPMWAYQRSLTATNPTPVTVAKIYNYGSIEDGTYTGSTLSYLSPTDNCAAMSGLFHGTTYDTPYIGTAANPPTGTYCGSKNVLGYTTLQNQSRSYDGMLKLRYDVNNYVRLYSDILADFQQQRWTPGSNFNWWGPIDYPYGLIEDASTTNILYPERVFGPEEVGNNYYNQLGIQDDFMYQADIGANGTFGDSNWNWDIYYLRSGDRTDESSPERMAAPVDAYFNSILGPVVGVDPNTGLNMYNPNYQAFYTPLTTAQLASFMQNITTFSNTWINNTRATISNDSLFALPGGNAGFAFLVEGGNQAWYEPLSPLIANGDVWGLTGTGGGGVRDHQGSAFELNLPVFRQLTVDLSGRYDRYKADGGSSSGKFTYKAGIEYRPFETLLLRGNYATSFLAPDMSALFLGPSGNYQSIIDYYLCAKNGGNQNCSANYSEEVQGTLLSNKNLKPTTAQSWTGGFVWSPTSNISFSADFLHIAIQNEIAPQSTDLMMRQDAQCLLGTMNNPSLCSQVESQVQRNALTDQVSTITQYYVNVSNEVTDSVTAEAKYRFDPTPFGTFGLQFDYNDMLKHQYQIYAGSMPINMLANPLYSSEFKSIATGALNWSLHDDTWSSTLYWHRYGPTPNNTAMTDGPSYPGAGKVSSWITWNWSLSYAPPAIKGLSLSMLINNVLNKMPPKDPTFATSFPYYNTSNYNVYGREIMLQADWKFGARTN